MNQLDKWMAYGNKQPSLCGIYIKWAAIHAHRETIFHRAGTYYKKSSAISCIPCEVHERETFSADHFLMTRLDR